MRSVWHLLVLLPALASAAVYHVDQRAADAADDNPGTAEAPWKTLARAGTATELQPGDTVLVHSGVYREHVDLTVSGEPDKPITFAAAPGARVVIKGSELVTSKWERMTNLSDKPEPYPNAYARVWRTKLGEEMFTDPDFAGAYQDPAQRWVSQVFIDETHPLQRIGVPRIYPNEGYSRLRQVGRGLEDITTDSFFFDPSDGMLYLNLSGDPAWYVIEVGVRGFVLTARNCHDVVIRGFEMRHNRQPGGQWPMVSLHTCERVLLEDCSVRYADFGGLSLYKNKHSRVSGCDLSHNGNNGLGMSYCEDTVVEDSAFMFNNYRHFHAGWHAGGAKLIPGNVRVTIQRCEAAYNEVSPGIWFDYDNADIRILDNVVHHNGECGIFFEINKGGGIIANNLVYSNQSRGIYISGSQHTWVVNNTVADNNCGIVAMPRGDDWPLEDVHILNNLLLGNYLAGPTITRGNDVTVYMGPKPETFERTVTSNHSDHNVFANNSWTPTMRQHWNPDNTLGQWRDRYGEDLNSVETNVPYEQRGTGFRLPTDDVPQVGTALPAELPWQPKDPKRVGAERTSWP